MRAIATMVLTISHFLLFGQAHGRIQPESSKPFVLGTIREIKSIELKEKRILNIYLPEGYKSGDSSRYPVVYLLDGSADEDFIHIVGLYQFNSFPWINRVPKSIIVGIANVDRKRDFTYPTSIESDKKKYPTSGKSEKFIRFLARELQPYVDHQFKTNDDRTIIGESLGGLLASEILLKRPAMFNRYIIVSPSLWWDDGSLLKIKSIPFQNGFNRKTDVYIGVGKEGQAPGDIPHFMETDAKLLVEKLRESGNQALKIHFDYLPEENHATVGHQAVFNALRLLYPAAKEN